MRKSANSDDREDPLQPSGDVLSEFVPYPYQSLDEDGRILTVNDAWLDALGYERSTVIGNSFVVYLTEDSMEEFESAFHQFLARGSVTGLELELRDATGHTIGVRLDGQVEYGDDGAVGRAHCQFIDEGVADGDESMRVTGGGSSVDATEERLEMAIEGAQLGIWDWDMETDEVTRDELLTNMLGYSPAEMGDRLQDWERLVHPEGEQRHNEALAEHIENRTDYYQCDYRMETSEGDWKWVRTMGTVVERDSDGTPQRAVGIHMDIDEQKRNHQRLAKKTEQLEALNRVVRHDIRNEIGVVYMWAEELEAHVDEEGAAALDRVIEASRHVVELTEVAREFVESLGGDEGVEPKPVGLLAHLRTELQRQRELYPSAQFTVEGELPSVSVQANEMLSSVFRNLLVNAVEHNDSAVPKVRVEAAAQPDTVEVRIADNGPGISEAWEQKVFGKNEKGVESAGTGIGLYLIQSLLEGYGGDIWIADVDTDGAEFVVELPRAG